MAGNETPAVESYRLDQVEKSLEKFVERIEGKIDRLAETFATRAALDLVAQNCSSEIEQLNSGLNRVQGEVVEIRRKKSFITTLSVTVAIVSACITVITLYELMR